MATYLVVRIESCANLGTGLLIHVHYHAILQSTDKSLHINSVVADVHCTMELVVSRVFDHLVDQITGGTLPCFLYVVCVVVVICDRLSLLVLDKQSKFFLCLVHMGCQVLVYLSADLQMDSLFVGDVFC